MNCKPGDLAVCVAPRKNGCSEFVGRIVRVLSAYGEAFDMTGAPVGFCWRIEIQGTPAMTQGKGMQRRGEYPDACLRPIRPCDEPESIPTEAPCEVLAA